MAQQEINPGSAPVIWSDIASAFNTVNDNFTELYASIGGDAVNFTSLGTNLVPRDTEVYDLGTSAKRWRDVWLSGSSIHLGDAVITATGATVNLPVGSTIGGLRVDENYFKYIAVSGQDSIEADDGTDTLTIATGNNGITLTTDATTDTLTITNSGVTSLAGTAGQIGVSQSTGGVTLTNLGVTSAAAGQGISLNAGTGSVTITNSGVVGLDAGIGIQLSPRDPITGVVTVTNSQPNIPQQTFSIVAVPTQTPIAADSTADTLTIETSGDGLSITTAPLTDTLTFTNTGVTSLAVGNGLTVDAGTGSINLTLDATLSRNIIGDITGSVFADDSTKLVDAVEGLIVGNVDTGSLRTSESKIALGTSAGETTQGADTVAVGNLAGRTNQGTNGVAIGALSGTTNQGLGAVAVGSAAGNTGQGFSGVAIGYAAGGANQGQRGIAIGDQAGSTDQGDYAVAIGSLSGGSSQGTNSIAIGRNAGVGGTTANSIILNASGSALTSAAAGLYIDPVRTASSTGNILNYNTTTKELTYSDQELTLKTITVPDDQSFNLYTNYTNTKTTVLTISSLGRIYLPASTDYQLPERSVVSSNGSIQLQASGSSYNLGTDGTVTLPNDALYYSPGSDFTIKTATTLPDISPTTWAIENEGVDSTPVFAIAQETIGEGNLFRDWVDPTHPGTVQVKGPGILDGDTFVDTNTIDPYGDPVTVTIDAENGVFLTGETYTFQYIEELVDTTHSWQFGTDGTLTLPGRMIGDVRGDLTGSVFADDSSLLLDGTEGIFYGAWGTIANVTGTSNLVDNVGNFINLNADDAEFVRLGTAFDNPVEIHTNYDDTDNVWTFDASGELTVPGFIHLQYSGDVQGSIGTGPAGFSLVGQDDKDFSILLAPAESPPVTWEFKTDGTLTLPGTLYVSTIDTSDSSDITVVPAVTFNADVTVENELFVGASRVMPIAELKSIVAASTDFADFQARIAAL